MDLPGPKHFTSSLSLAEAGIEGDWIRVSGKSRGSVWVRSPDF